MCNVKKRKKFKLEYLCNTQRNRGRISDFVSLHLGVSSPEKITKAIKKKELLSLIGKFFAKTCYSSEGHNQSHFYDLVTKKLPVCIHSP